MQRYIFMHLLWVPLCRRYLGHAKGRKKVKQTGRYRRTDRGAERDCVCLCVCVWCVCVCLCVCVCVSLLLLFFCFFKSTFVGNDYWDRQYKTPSSDKATLMAIRSLFDYIFLGLRENGLFLSHFEAACHKQGSET